MKKSINLPRLMILLFALICSAFANAQTTRKLNVESISRYPTDAEQAKNIIVNILNGKQISVLDGSGKIKYEEAKAFDDRIELITKKGSKVFYFRDMFYPDDQKGIELFTRKEHVPKGESLLKEHDNYTCNIQNVRYLTFSDSYKIFEDGSTWNDPNTIRNFAEALSCFQHKIAKAYTDSINNNFAKKLENNLFEFRRTANDYQQLTVKPTVTEEQRKYIVQANALNNEKKYAEAIDFYKKAIEINPVAYPAAYYNLALLCAQTNDFKQAIFNIKKYLLLVPDAPDARAAQDKIYEWELKP
jgi:tetratricopeptide (TPR) repeat protein